MNLKNLVIKKIQNYGKPINLDEFISVLLYEDVGYYINKHSIGENFDFITSPEISQMFGEIIGAYILDYWNKKIKSNFNLVELGPGNGTLLSDILRTSNKLNKDFYLSTNIKLIEKNKKYIDIQKKKILSYKIKNIEWLKEFKINSNLPSIIYSNEFFDCLPIRQFYKKNIWYEKMVDYNKSNDIFFLKDVEVKNKKLLEYLKKYNETKLVEISVERKNLFQKLCKHIKKNKGLIILIDYGYDKNIKNFTLQTVSLNKKSHIFENLGLQDISSLVNFNELINIAKDYKLNIINYCSQKEFLISNGIRERKDRLKKNLSSNKKLLIEKQYKTLTNKNMMGENFKFFIVST